jgi:hypothetical protein
VGSSNSSVPPGHHDSSIVLGVLSAVESNSRITQRKLSRDLGIALGLTNLYLKRCVRKGWVKVGQVPMKRYAYYLTPKGFVEKARLAGEYLSWNLEFFRRARRQTTELFLEARDRGLRRFVLIGAGDLAEVAILSAADAGIEVIAVIDPGADHDVCAGKPVYHSARDFLALKRKGEGMPQGLMVTHASDPMQAFEVAKEVAVAAQLPVTTERILLPRILSMPLPLRTPGELLG